MTRKGSALFIVSLPTTTKRDGQETGNCEVFMLSIQSWYTLGIHLVGLHMGVMLDTCRLHMQIGNCNSSVYNLYQSQWGLLRLQCFSKCNVHHNYLAFTYLSIYLFIYLPTYLLTYLSIKNPSPDLLTLNLCGYNPEIYIFRYFPR